MPEVAVDLADYSDAQLSTELARRLAVVATPAPALVDHLQLLDADEVAKLLGLTTGVIYEMARRGEIGHVSPSIGSRSVRFTRQQVADFIKSREKSAVK